METLRAPSTRRIRGGAQSVITAGVLAAVVAQSYLFAANCGASALETNIRHHHDDYVTRLTRFVNNLARWPFVLCVIVGCV